MALLCDFYYLNQNQLIDFESCSKNPAVKIAGFVYNRQGLPRDRAFRALKARGAVRGLQPVQKQLVRPAHDRPAGVRVYFADRVLAEEV